MVNKMNKQLTCFVFAMACFSAFPVLADKMKTSDMDMDMNDMDMSSDKSKAMSDMKGMDHSKMKGMDHSDMKGMDHGSMSGHSMSMGSMQGGSAPADARDPHAFSDGYDFGDVPPPVLADELNFASLLVDRLEAINATDNKSLTYDLQFWYGRDYDRLVIKSEGDYDNNELEETSTEVLWSHALAPYWNSQLGVRYDSADNNNQTWLGFGVQGLAPYWFELDMTGYIGEEGRTAFNLEAEYEILITQKLILQPRMELDIIGKDEKELGIGSGLSNASAGIRLRYEIRREIAPYVGAQWVSKLGKTADYAKENNIDTSESQIVAGIRFWF